MFLLHALWFRQVRGSPIDDNSRPLMEIGFNSQKLLELGARLSNELGGDPVPASFLFSFFSVDLIISRLFEELERTELGGASGPFQKASSGENLFAACQPIFGSPCRHGQATGSG